MTTFTKVSNFILRGTIVTALAAAVMQITSGGTLLSNLFSGASTADEIAANAAGMNLSGLMSQGNILTIVLLFAGLFSCFAFYASGKAASTLRTITLLGLAGISAVGNFLFNISDILVRSMNGTAAASELTTVKPIIDAAAENGASQGAMADVLAVFGIAAAVITAAVLGILVLTSIVSVVKTVKAEKTVKIAAAAA